jgi:hypothetical protein
MELLPKVDVVIADCIMPEIEVFDRLVRDTHKPVARMSGLPVRATNMEISKPFTKKQILETVEMLRFFHSPSKLRRPGRIAA